MAGAVAPAALGGDTSPSASSTTSPASARRTATPSRASTSTSPSTSPRSSASKRTRSTSRRPVRPAGDRHPGWPGRLIFATYSITDARKEKVSFAGPYFIAGQDLLVRSDNTDITGPDSMDGKKLCSVTGSTPAEKIKEEYATTVKLFEQDTYSKCVEALVGGTVDAVTTDNVILAGFAAQPQYAGKLKVVGKPFSDREVRRRAEEGRHRALRQGQCGAGEDGLRRLVAEGGGRQCRSLRLQGRHDDQPAEAGALLVAVSAVGPAARRPPTAPRSFRGVRGRPPRLDEGKVRRDGFELLAEYNVLGAFWMTIKLTVLSAVGALVIGTVVAVMRVSPVRVLRALGTAYVTLVRNTPLTLIVFFCAFGFYITLQYRIGAQDSTDRRTELPLGRARRWPSTTPPSWPRPCAAASTPSRRGRPRPPGDRAATSVQPCTSGAASGVSRRDRSAGQRADRADQEHHSGGYHRRR